MAQRESIMDLINRLGVEKPDPRLRMDPYNYPSGAPDVGAGLQEMGQRLENKLNIDQGDNLYKRLANLFPRLLFANPAQDTGALLQVREPEIEQLKTTARQAVDDPKQAAKAVGQSVLEAVSDPVTTVEGMSALDFLGGSAALRGIARRLGRKNIDVVDVQLKPDVQPTQKGKLSQQLYEQAVARGEVPGEAALTQLRQSTDAADFVRRQFIEDLPDVEKARVDRAVKQGFNIDAFHGTAGNIADFDPGLLGKTTKAPSARKAFFFSADPETALAYVVDADPVKLNRFTEAEHRKLQARLQNEASDARDRINKIYDQIYDEDITKLDEEGKIRADLRKQSLTRLQKKEDLAYAIRSNLGGNIMPVKLRMTNPLVHDFKGEDYREVSYNDLLQTAKDKGHDGVIMKNTTDGGPVTDIYAVFEPQQIRSRYATFDPDRVPREFGDRPYSEQERRDKIRELQDEIQSYPSRSILMQQKKEDLAALLKVQFGAKDELRIPKRTAGPTNVLANAAFPLGGITAAISYDVNQRGDR